MSSDFVTGATGIRTGVDESGIRTGVTGVTGVDVTGVDETGVRTGVGVTGIGESGGMTGIDESGGVTGISGVAGVDETGVRTGVGVTGIGESGGMTGIDESGGVTGISGVTGVAGVGVTGVEASDWPLFEVFLRAKRGLNHVHVGSLHAADPSMALRHARDVYTRRNEGVSIWVVRASQITASSPDEHDAFFDPSGDKVYRHPTFYAIPDTVPHI